MSTASTHDQDALEVDPWRCIGTGNCEYLAPSTFELNEDSVSQVVDPEGDDPEKIDQAIEECPAAAISRRLKGA